MLTYYQAVELMSCLPILLSPENDGSTLKDEMKGADSLNAMEDLSEMESWYLVNRSMTANGEYFAD